MKSIPLIVIEEKLLSLLTEHFGADKAQRISDVILYAEQHGIEGQGLAKLAGTEPLQSIKPEAELEISHKSDVSCQINAHRQPSFYAAQTGVDIAINIAKRKGIAVVGINGVYSSIGSLAYYVERIAQEDMIGIVMAQCPPSIAPFGVLPPLFGTNPLGVAFPTNDKPVVFDMATAAITWYGLVLAKMRGQTIPDGLAIDTNGNLTNDPKAAMDGAILPFGNSAKASGLAMMVEMMAGPLVGATGCNVNFDGDWGVFILAFKPSLLVDTEVFKTNASAMIEIIRKAPTVNGEKVRLPGDRANAFKENVLQTGMIELDEAIAAVFGL